MSEARVKKSLLALLASAFFSSSHAETPCDFKGISVGDKATPAEVMTALGVAKYKTNPKRASREEMLPNVSKYGLSAAAEIADWDMGPWVRTATRPHAEFHTAMVLAMTISRSTELVRNF
jgi:hypothetical protein